MKIITLIAIGALAAVSAARAEASIVTLTSSNFSLGYGYSGNFAWDTTETSGSNTPTTQGNFTFTPSVSGLGVSGAGPIFTSRTLADGDAGFNTAGARASTFQATVTGAYTGTLPFDAFNLQITLDITDVKIWGVKPGALSENRMQWQETTVGNTGLSSIVILNTAVTAVDQKTASLYLQNDWNPADPVVAGVSSTRAFNLNNISNNVDSLYEVDGFEVLGNVVFSYEVPEPASLSLLGLGLLTVVARRRK